MSVSKWWQFADLLAGARAVLVVGARHSAPAFADVTECVSRLTWWV
jgi:hypothetical protein